MDKGNYQRGLEAYERGDHDAALRDLRPLAEQGFADAQYQLAMSLWHQGKNFFDREVSNWFKKAASQGHAEAQFELGSNIMENDLPKSKSWLLAAADQEHAKACMELCHLEMEYGLGEAEGLKWYCRGRELGHPHDPSYLGIYPAIVKSLVGTHEEYICDVVKEAKAGMPGKQYLLGCWYAAGEPPFRQNMIRAYAWFVVAINSPPPDQRSKYPGSWGTPARAVRLLEQVFNDAERRRAHRLADYYGARFS